MIEKHVWEKVIEFQNCSRKKLADLLFNELDLMESDQYSHFEKMEILIKIFAGMVVPLRYFLTEEAFSLVVESGQQICNRSVKEHENSHKNSGENIIDFSKYMNKERS